MRILVTGGLGFIGSNFVRRLLSSGDYEVTNLDLMTYGSNEMNVSDLLPNVRYRFVKGDIADSGLIGESLKEADAVVNFAAETHVDRSISSGAPFMQSNVLGVFSIIEGLRKAGRTIPMVQVGTDEEYGEIGAGSFSERDALSPSSPYAASKAAASMLILAHVRTYGIDAKVTRCTNNYGPYQFPEKLIPKSIIRAQLGLKVPVYGDGRNARDWIHVEDHCEAIELVMRRGKSGSVYNIAGGTELQNLDVVKRILGAMKKPEDLIEFVEDRPGHDRRYSLDDRKIRAELGWAPRRSFQGSLERTVSWYSENEGWWRPLANEKTLSPAPWKLGW